MTTGQRTVIEVVRDCLSIMEDAFRLYNMKRLEQKEYLAIVELVNQHLDEVLRPLYPKQKDASEAA